MRLRLAAILAATALASSAPSQAQAPDPQRRELTADLAVLGRGLAREGYSRTAGPFYGGLARGGAHRLNITLRGGGDFRLVASCDSSCRDVDMRLYDHNGYLISSDMGAARIATVTSQPRWTGLFTVEVVMSNCSATTCYFAFNIYGR